MNTMRLNLTRVAAALLTAGALALPGVAEASAGTVEGMRPVTPMVPMPLQPRIELSTSVVPHRTLLVVTVSGFQPGEQVRVEAAGRVVRTVVADLHGRASTHRVIDRGTCGTGCAVTATGAASGQVSAEFQGLRRR